METFERKTNTNDNVNIRMRSPSSSPPSLPSSPPPTALLLGWLGAKHRNLDKYSQLFANMGYNTVQTVAPYPVVFPWHPRTTVDYVLSVLRIVASDDRLTAGGLVIQMFSNGGAVFAPPLSALISGTFPGILAEYELTPSEKADIEKVKESLAAVVFDCAPAFVVPKTAAVAMCDALRAPFPVQLLVSAAVISVFFLQRVFVFDMPKFFWDQVRTSEYGCPELYIYSKKDHLVDDVHLEALILERQQHGQSVRSLSFEDAEHVLILRKYPDEYTTAINGVNGWGVNAWREEAGLDPWKAPRSS